MYTQLCFNNAIHSFISTIVLFRNLIHYDLTRYSTFIGYFYKDSRIISFYSKF